MGVELLEVRICEGDYLRQERVEVPISDKGLAEGLAALLVEFVESPDRLEDVLILVAV